TAPAPAVAPAPLPVTRPQLIGPLLEEWRAAGLLDAPFRPPEVGAIPPLTDPRQAASPPGPAGDGGGSGPVSPAFLGPVPPVTVPGPQAPPVTVPAPGRPPMPGPALIPPWLAGIAVFLTVLLTPTETAPPWMDELNPITGGPYGSPEEYLWTRQLTAAQQDYLRYLSRARRLRPDAAADGDVDPRVLPQPEPAPDPDRSATCFGTDVPRKGGHARHDAYATKVTQSVNDYFVRTPESLKINYDGLLRPATVWEVKVGYGWFFNPELAGVRDARLAQWDVQKNVGLAIAARCGYVHLWAHPDRHVAQLLTARWGGAPPVLNIPE
ncbi:MAG TPA: hypothetical protein VES42_01490, partial [Pilimelia sp.]|nr:hypothetical protein [Pilimelia sp.]